MTTNRSHASGRRGPGSARLSSSVGSNLPLEACARRGEGVHRDVFVDVHGLGMLSEVVEAGKSASAVTLKGALPSVFPVCQSMSVGEDRVRVWLCSSPDVARKMLAAGEA